MSAATTINHHNNNTISEMDDENMFQAAKRSGRRNALADLAEQISQVNTSIPSFEVDQMTPHFQSMSIKH